MPCRCSILFATGCVLIFQKMFVKNWRCGLHSSAPYCAKNMVTSCHNMPTWGFWGPQSISSISWVALCIIWKRSIYSLTASCKSLLLMLCQLSLSPKRISKMLIIGKIYNYTSSNTELKSSAIISLVILKTALKRLTDLQGPECLFAISSSQHCTHSFVLPPLQAFAPSHVSLHPTLVCVLPN